MNQVYWFTSLACLPAQRQAVETGSCVLEIPGPDIKLDLLAWSAHTYYTANSELAGQQRSFQLNLCRPASTSLCGNESLVCEVDDNWETAKQNIIEKDPVKLASYDALREVIVLKYDSGTARVTIEIECDAGEEKARVSLVHNNGSDYTFSMKTAKACFVPVSYCLSTEMFQSESNQPFRPFTAMPRASLGKYSTSRTFSPRSGTSPGGPRTTGHSSTRSRCAALCQSS